MSLLRALLSQPPLPKPTVIRRREIFDLSETRLNRVYYYVGNNLSVEGLTGGTIQLRFDQPDATLFTLAQGQSYPQLPFNRLYLTNVISQGNTLTVEFDCYDFTHEQQFLESTTALTDLLNNIKSSPIMLIDAGTRIEAESSHVGPANVVLYTVPANRLFYFIGFSNWGSTSNIAVAWESQLYYTDPALLASYNISLIGNRVANQPPYSMAENGAFTMFVLTPGWSIRSFAPNATSNVESMIVGIEL